MESFIVVVAHSKHKTKISQTKRCNAAAICYFASISVHSLNLKIFSIVFSNRLVGVAFTNGDNYRHLNLLS